MIAFEERGETGEALEEGFVILTLGLRPLHLGEGRHTGQRLILHHLLVGHILRPEVGLRAEDMTAGLDGEAVRSGIEAIDPFDGNSPPPAGSRNSNAW